ncbi:MAG: hypothetical protein AB7Q29_19270 [Vicinamibacterales bacterium]
MTISALLRAADRTAQTTDRLSRDFARELAQVVRAIERRLPGVLRAAAAGSPSAIIRAAQANRTRQQLRDVVRAAGFDALLTEGTGSRLSRLAASVLAGQRIAELSADLTPTLARRVEALQLLMQSDLLAEGDTAARALWRATVRGVFGGQDTEAILDDLARVLTRTEAQIATLYDTSISVFGRQVQALQATERDDATYAFVGPVDARTRDWCLAHVGRVFTRAEIDTLDNGQIGPVFLTGGGYNCRHTWMEVSRFSELRDLVGTRQRIPEIASDLARLREAA